MKMKDHTTVRMLEPGRGRTSRAARKRGGERGPHYKWVVLSNTTLGILMATINSSILLISLPAIFNGIFINPLAPAATNYLAWMLLGYIVVTATLVVSLSPLSCVFARVRIFNLGSATFTLSPLM